MTIDRKRLAFFADVERMGAVEMTAEIMKESNGVEELAEKFMYVKHEGQAISIMMMCKAIIENNPSKDGICDAEVCAATALVNLSGYTREEINILSDNEVGEWWEEGKLTSVRDFALTTLERDW